MKKITAVLMIFSMLAVGCIGGGDEQTTTTAPSTTPAVPTTTAAPTEKSLEDVFTPLYKDKMWAKHMAASEGQEIPIIMRMFDEDEMYIFETEAPVQGIRAVIQVWYSATGESILEGELVKYAVKMDETVYCTKATTAPAPLQYPEKYSMYSVVRETTYTTPTGKEVPVFVVKDGTEEYWFSSEVPFSIVKIISDGEEILILNDFGFDAEREISREEIEHCQPMETPPQQTTSP